MFFSCCSFTGKEKDEETGYGYFGARYMDHELMTMWLSVDPMSDKYPSISPYAYCAWNPIKLVDPDGQDVFITGDEESKEDALKQIQQKSKNMIFSIDENGKLTFEGKAKTKMEKYMKRIIMSSQVSVDLCVQNNSAYDGETIDAGAFYGNMLSDDGEKVYASQIVNVKRASFYDKKCKSPGNMIWHEISEAYEGGLISLDNQTDAEPKRTGIHNPIYNSAHYNAGKFFPGSIQPFDVEYPEGLQSALRYIGVTITINSTYRTYTYVR